METIFRSKGAERSPWALAAQRIAGAMACAVTAGTQTDVLEAR